MDLPLEDRPLFRLSALRIGPTAIVGKEGLLPKLVQASLLFAVIGPLCDAPLAQEIAEVVAALAPVMRLQAVMHPQQMPTVHGLQLYSAIEAIECHHRFRFRKIAYVADAPVGGFGQPPGIYILPIPKQRQQDFEEIGVVQGPPRSPTPRSGEALPGCPRLPARFAPKPLQHGERGRNPRRRDRFDPTDGLRYPQ